MQVSKEVAQRVMLPNTCKYMKNRSKMWRAIGIINISHTDSDLQLL